ncbi:hypothetical protein KGQ29_03875 [Patescibacteria group bacterium]|nr:hypothetical protein [Patescibacteria group bacterium]
MKLTDIDFPSFKERMAKECKAKNACIEEYRKLLGANNINELYEVLCRNYYWLYRNEIDCPLPDGLTVEVLYMNGCTGITELPEGLTVEVLYMNGCTGITELPEGLTVEVLVMRGCSPTIPLTARITTKIY